MNANWNKEVFLAGYKRQKFYGRWYPSAGQEDPAIIMLHGLLTDCREFGFFPMILAKDYNVSVFVFDFNGHGKSEGTRQLLSKELQIADINAAIEYVRAYNKNKIFVLGHSFGAHAALLTQKSNSHVSGAVLVAPQIRSGDSLKPVSKFLFRFIGTVYRIFPFLPSIYLQNRPSYEELYPSPDQLEEAKRIDFISKTKNLKVTGYAVSADNSIYVVSSVKPLLIVGCENDHQIPEERVQKLAGFSKSENVEYYSLKNAGHSPFLVKNSDLLKKISEFCHETNSKN